jgi:hypothetical protein
VSNVRVVAGSAAMVVACGVWTACDGWATAGSDASGGVGWRSVDQRWMPMKTCVGAHAGCQVGVSQCGSFVGFVAS